MSTAEKCFTLTPTFPRLWQMRNSELKLSEFENHYGINWEIAIQSLGNHLSIYLRAHPEQDDGWTIEAQMKVEITSLEGKLFHKQTNYDIIMKGVGIGFLNFIEWSELSRKYIRNNRLRVKCHVTIKSVSGITKQPLRRFDKSMERFSDVILKVGGQDFYVSKLTLAMFSSYFEGMFLRGFVESNKSEIELDGVDPEHFQEYLDLICAFGKITDCNVENLLGVADIYLSPTIIKKCEEYLMSDASKLSRKDKLRLASQFHLEELANLCLDQCKSSGEEGIYIMPDDESGFLNKVLAKRTEALAKKIAEMHFNL